MKTTYFHTPCGIMEGVFRNEALVSLDFTNLPPNREYEENQDFPLALETSNWLEAYFQGCQLPTPPMQPAGTEFQKKIWSILMKVPFGETISYSAVKELYLRETGRERMCVRTVAHAVSRNPILLMVPCHRVIRSNGDTGKYGGGADRKEFLLGLEKSYSGKP